MVGPPPPPWVPDWGWPGAHCEEFPGLAAAKAILPWPIQTPAVRFWQLLEGTLVT